MEILKEKNNLKNIKKFQFKIFKLRSYPVYLYYISCIISKFCLYQILRDKRIIQKTTNYRI